MNTSDFSAAQRAYDYALPEPEGKFVCRQCGEERWESERSYVNPNICDWCEDRLTKDEQ